MFLQIFQDPSKRYDKSYIEVVIKSVKTLDKFFKITEDHFLNSLWTASNQTGQPFLQIQIPQIDEYSLCDSLELHPCQGTF